MEFYDGVSEFKTSTHYNAKLKRDKKNKWYKPKMRIICCMYNSIFISPVFFFYQLVNNNYLLLRLYCIQLVEFNNWLRKYISDCRCLERVPGNCQSINNSSMYCSLSIWSKKCNILNKTSLDSLSLMSSFCLKWKHSFAPLPTVSAATAVFKPTFLKYRYVV